MAIADEQPPRIWKIPVAVYHRMIDCGALDENDRLELIDGFLIAKRNVAAPPPIVDALWRDSPWARVGAQLWPVSVDKYHRMIDGGVFDGGVRLELIGGVLVEMSPQSKAHVHAMRRLTALLVRALPEEIWSVRPQAPMSLPGWEPEPDVAVVDRKAEEAAPRHPQSAALVVEVAASSIGFDRLKRQAYAAAGVTEYWIVDVEARRVEVYREPLDGVYAAQEIVDEGGAIRPVAFADVEVEIADLMLPRATTP
jgi:Uma2 family endonuclease